MGLEHVMVHYPVLAPAFGPRQRSKDSEDSSSSASSSSGPNPKGLQHSEDEWLAVYPHIELLYIQERWKLRDVMTRMARVHGFRATEQMYKRRFTKWGFAKNKPRQSTRPCVSGKAASSARDAADDASAPSRTLDADAGPEILDEAETNDVEPHATTAATITTKPKTCLQLSLPSSPKIGQSEAATLTLLHSIRVWSAGNFGSGAWALKPWCLTSSLVDRVDEQSSASLQRLLTLSSDLYARDEGVLAGKTVRKAFLCLEDVVRRRGPSLFWDVVDILYAMLSAGHTVLLRLFLQHFSELAKSMLPRDHPLRKFLAPLCGRVEDKVEFERLLKLASRCNRETMEQHTGPEHLSLYETIVTESASGVRPSMNLDDEADKMLATLVKMEGIAAADGGPEYSLLRIALLREEIENVLQRIPPEERISSLDKIIARCGPGFKDVRPYSGYFAGIALGLKVRLKFQVGDWDDAEALTRMAIRIRIQEEGPSVATHTRALTSLSHLEGVLRDAGRTERAEAVREDTVLLVSKLLEDIPDTET